MGRPLGISAAAGGAAGGRLRTNTIQYNTEDNMYPNYLSRRSHNDVSIRGPASVRKSGWSRAGLASLPPRSSRGLRAIHAPLRTRSSVKAIETNLLSERCELFAIQRQRRSNSSGARTTAMKEKRRLRAWFGELDEDDSGEVSVEELEGPLISTGIAKSLVDVKRIVASVDQDSSGAIGFKEFLAALQNDESGGDEEGEASEGARRSKVAAAAPPKAATAVAPGGATGKKEKKSHPILELQRMKDESPLSLNTLICQRRRALLMEETMTKNVRRLREFSATEAAYAKAYQAGTDNAITGRLRVKMEREQEHLNSRAEFMDSMRRVVVNSYNNENSYGRDRDSGGISEISAGSK